MLRVNSPTNNDRVHAKPCKYIEFFPHNRFLQHIYGESVDKCAISACFFNNISIGA